MIAAQTPTIAKIKNEASETDARALLYIAICEVCDFFNVGKNMTDIQIALTADLIIEQYWYLKLEEIKYCFRRAMCTEKVYDRLDGNIILGWLGAYDAERTEEAMRLSDNEQSLSQSALNQPSEDAVSLDEYKAILSERAALGDAEAADKLRDLDLMAASGISLAKSRDNEIDFKKFFYNYVKKRKGESKV